MTFAKVSQLDQDTSIALATIREWRNSFIHINRIPLDVLSLIPTHLSSQRDRLYASFVCRHWRRVFIQRAELWSKLFLSNSGDYVKTFLERAKGSVLDVIVDGRVPPSTNILLSSNTRRMRSLDFSCDEWITVQNFSLLHPGPFPLLHTLTIDTADMDSFSATTLPSKPLFASAVNLRVFRFRSKSSYSPPLSRFIFPNLVSLELSVEPSEVFHPSQLFDFLAASPMLRTVAMAIIGRISFEGVPRERVVTLPNVKSFNLVMSDGGPGYKIAAHISCPSARSTSLMYKRSAALYTVPDEMFPAPGSWEAIVRQYARSPVEEVKFELVVTPIILCTLTFRSADGTLIELRFKVVDGGDRSFLPSPEMQKETLSQSARAVESHPQVANVRRLRLCHSFRFICSPDDSYIANEVGRLFRSVGPLDELTIYRCDLRPYSRFPLSLPNHHTEETVVFPPTRTLTISHPDSPDIQFKVAVTAIVKSQHALGMPFERLIIHRESMPIGIEERLRPWVGRLEYHCDKSDGNQDGC